LALLRRKKEYKKNTKAVSINYIIWKKSADNFSTLKDIFNQFSPTTKKMYSKFSQIIFLLGRKAREYNRKICFIHIIFYHHQHQHIDTKTPSIIDYYESRYNNKSWQEKKNRTEFEKTKNFPLNFIFFPQVFLLFKRDFNSWKNFFIFHVFQTDQQILIERLLRLQVHKWKIESFGLNFLIN
jgi:hypothetical protein